MKLAASSIGWDATDEEDVAKLMREFSLTGVELAPTKWRPDAFTAPVADVRSLRQSWASRGLPVVALQALLFGRPDLQLFGSDESRASLDRFLRRVIDFASTLGARALVFGSPKNRVRGALSDGVALEIAAEFFRTIAPYAHDNGCVICIEPNPAEYGCDFLTTTAEAIAFCRSVDHPGVALNLDAGTMTMNDEEPAATIAAAAGLLGHVHASEPRLSPLASDGRHERLAMALSNAGYDGWVSIETLKTAEGIAALRGSMSIGKRSYIRA